MPSSALRSLALAACVCAVLVAAQDNGADSPTDVDNPAAAAAVRDDTLGDPGIPAELQPSTTPASTTTTSHKSVVHGEGQPSIAGYGLWIGFCVIVVIGLALDNELSKKYTAIGKIVRGAFISSVGWVGAALAFAVFLGMFYGAEVGLVFVTGYLVEESLSVDNLVVIALIFKSFKIHAHNQGPVLKWGIWGAVVFRLIFIFAGVWLLEHMHATLYIFGGILLWSAWKMYSEEDDDEDGHNHSGTDTLMMRMMTAVIPYNADAKGQRFIEHHNGKAHATPMLAALVVVELSDLLFAVDSIPCILGLTHDLFLVFSSNMFAILGLRSLYLLLAELMDKVKNLKTGLAIVLAFVGTKMMLGEWFPMSQSFSLFVIFSIVGGTVLKSVLDSKMGRDKPKMVLPC